jgi:hypothetical protein
MGVVEMDSHLAFVSRSLVSRNALASGSKCTRPGNVCRSSTRQLALLGYDC